MPSLVTRRFDNFFSGGAVPWPNGYVYVVVGGWYANERTLTVYRCSQDLSSCTQVATGPSIEDTYCCTPQDGKLWFGGMHRTNGGIIGYYDPSTNSIDYVSFPEDLQYRKYLTPVAYNNVSRKWFIGGAGNGGGSVYIVDNPLNKTTWVNVSSQYFEGSDEIYIFPVLGSRKVLFQMSVVNFRTRVYIADISSDWTTISNKQVVFERSTPGPTGWMSYQTSTMCGDYIFVADMYYDSEAGAGVNRLLRVNKNNFSDVSEVYRLTGSCTGCEGHNHVSSILDKYVLLSAGGTPAFGKLVLFDTTGNQLWETDFRFHVELNNVHYGNKFGIHAENPNPSSVPYIDVGYIQLDESDPFLNVSVSGYTINVSNAYPNSVVKACKAHSRYGNAINLLGQMFDKCITATADSSGRATITVDEPGDWIVIS